MFKKTLSEVEKNIRFLPFAGTHILLLIFFCVIVAIFIPSMANTLGLFSILYLMFGAITYVVLSKGHPSSAYTTADPISEILAWIFSWTIGFLIGWIYSQVVDLTHMNIKKHMSFFAYVLLSLCILPFPILLTYILIVLTVKPH